MQERVTFDRLKLELTKVYIKLLLTNKLKTDSRPVNSFHIEL